MTLREIELELWQEFGRTAGVAPETVTAAVSRASMANVMMDEPIPEAQVAEVRAYVSSVINEHIFLFARKN